MHRINLGYTLLMLAAVVTCGVLLRRTQKKLPLTAAQKLGLAVK